MRRWFVVFPLVTVFVIYFGALWIFPAPVDLPAAILSSALYLWSYPLARSTESRRTRCTRCGSLPFYFCSPS